MTRLRPQKARLDLEEGIDFLVSEDEDINNLYSCYGLLKLKPRKDYFRSLVSSIISQQLSNKAAKTILKRFMDLYGDNRFPNPDDILNTPRHLIRKAGLSESKACYITGLAEAIKDRSLQLDHLSSASNEQVRETLIKIKGIGDWTADMFLIFSLNRPDIFHIKDLGICKGFAVLLGLPELPKPEFMATYSSRWKPFRTVVSLYLWKIVDEPESYKPNKN